MTTEREACELCGKPCDMVRPPHVNTGVTSYTACYPCWEKWIQGDRTLEALRELQAQKETQ